MQSLLHDPYARLTKTQRQEAEARAARLRRIASKAVCKAPEDSTAAACEPAAKTEPVDFKAWYARQERLNPLPKEPWFEIVDEIDALPKSVSVTTIQNVVAAEYNIQRSNMLSLRRTAHVVRARQIAYYLAKRLTMRSLPDIGRRFGRDHTSVLSGIRKIERLMKADHVFAAHVESLAETLLGKPSGETP